MKHTLPHDFDASKYAPRRPHASSCLEPRYSAVAGIGKKAGVGRPAIRRMAHRGGVQRMTKGVYRAANDTLVEHLAEVIRDAMQYKDYSRRDAITYDDVKMAIRRQGRILYGM